MCSRPETYRGKVAVIGASSFLRRDRHYTPIGNLSGAEVVINATRSFVLNPLGRDQNVLESVLKKGWIMLVCLIPWFVYFCISEFRQRRRLADAQPTGRCSALHRQGRRTPGTRSAVITLLLFVTTLAVVTGITFKMSYASFSVLVGVLAVAIEAHFEGLKCVLNLLDRVLNRILGLPNDSTH